MSKICDACPIRKGCDWLSEMCRLSPREVARLRPDLISREAQAAAREARRKAQILALAKKNAHIIEAVRLRRIETAKLGFKKYDKRRKNSRRYWRQTA